MNDATKNYTDYEANFINKCEVFVREYAERCLDNSDKQVVEAIEMKLEHTGYVQLHSSELASVLGLNRHDVFLSELIGLLHDVGRFRQFQVYKTFVDALSEDHAYLGIKVISDTGFLDELSEYDKEIVLFAIANHNKRVIEANSDEKKLLLARIIRDADKLDIFRVLSPFLEPSDGLGVNTTFVDEFNNGVQCDYSKIQTKDDRKIVRLIWAYDINYSWTMKQVVKCGYLEKIIDCIMPNEALLPGVNKLRNHVRKKCNEKTFVHCNI